ncbi:MAG TPA: hypothetical protein VMA36_10705 [Candidatus Limnocylindria bacterium]|nr:hypothetical protein [Candidatus Limnocylindria bacterium]
MQTPDVREAAKGAADISKSFLTRQVDAGTKQLGVRVESMANDLRSAGQQLRTGSASPVADYVERGAALAERVGRYLEESDSSRLVSDLETFARERPLALAASAAALGFAVSRLIKTSSSRRYRYLDAEWAP